jgi:hypothetical protein
MSNAVKTIAQVALPIAGSFFGPVGAAIGGAAGGAIGGGGIKGAALGALTGYMGAGAAGNIMGTPAAGGILWNTPGQTINWAPPGVSLAGSGIRGVASGGGMNAIRNTISGLTQSTSVPGASIPGSSDNNNDPSRWLLALGNQAMTQSQARTAEKSANTQAAAIDRGIAENRPYTQLGSEAADRIRSIESNPAEYIRNNPLYTSLAADAERRLLANRAAVGKVGSGGTAQALQQELLNLGTGLINSDVRRLQGQVDTGAGAASGVAGMYGQQGAVRAAGQVGAQNAYTSGYQNQLNTLLALNNMRGQYGNSSVIYR